MKTGDIIKAVFSTIRAGNLFMISLSLFLVRYTIIQPLLKFGNTSSSISSGTFIFLVLSVLLIAAGGYVINDYFDTGIDAINKPEKNKVGKVIPKKSALAIYLIFTVTGLILSWWFGEKAGIRYPLLVMLVCAGLLYFYSATYKKMFLIGNFIIAILTGLIIYLPVLFDPAARAAAPIIVLTIAYAIFAFLITLVREIIKDCEDLNGDLAYDASTLPVVAGVRTARIIASIITVTTFAALLWVQIIQQQWDDMPAFLYVTIFIQAPLLFLFYKIIRSDSKATDHFNSSFTKFIMVTGILSMPVFYITSF